MRIAGFLAICVTIGAVGGLAVAQTTTTGTPYAERLIGRKDRSWLAQELRSFRVFPHRDRYYRLMAEGRWRAAAEELKTILEIDPAADSMRFALIKLYYGHGRHEAALDWADRLIKRRPSFAPAYFYRGLINYEAGRRGAARESLDRALALGGLMEKDREKAESLSSRIGLESTYINVQINRRLLMKAAPEIRIAALPPSPRPKPDIAAPPAESPSPLRQAFTALEKEQPEKALKLLRKAKRAGAGPRADLYRGYALRRLEKPDAARTAFEAALAATDGLSDAERAAAWRELGYLYVRAGENARAIKAFDAARRIDSEPPAVTAQRGYALLAVGDREAARTALSRAASDLEKPGAVYENIGYISKRLGEPKAAAENFRRAIDAYTGTGEDDRIRPLKQEVEWIADRFDAGLYTLLRGRANGAPTPLDRNLQQSQGGVSLSFLPPDMGYDSGANAKIFGRLLWSYRDNTLRPVTDSAQAGIGMRFRPLDAHDLVLSAERLIAVGRDARDDWMLRAGYAFSHGLAPRFGPEAGDGPAARLYLDGALIDPDTADLYLNGEGRAGWAWRPAEGTIFWPHAVVAANVQDDRFGSASLVEAGAGLALHFRFGESRYRINRNTVELSIQYRGKIAGDSVGGSGLVFLLSLRR